MTDRPMVLVTGAAGFIGSHTCLELLDRGHEVVGVDDFSNSSSEAVDRVRELSGRPFPFHRADLRDEAALHDILTRHDVATVVHFAAKKAVAESVELPLEYYDVNVRATVALLRAMRRHDVHRIVFSSSCSIYGEAERVPLTERDPPRPTNPYARTKWMCEEILADTVRRYPHWTAVALRYFNPVGAHPSGRLGEDPRGVPNNVMPYLMQVAVGRRPHLRVFGSDYPTPDGTGVRDYIHVVDLADGHRAALEHLTDRPGLRVLNLGTGVGTSVLELVHAFSEAVGRPLPYEIVGRRPGDVAALVADPRLAADEIGWTATRGVAAMCRDAWAFQRGNPGGYEHDDQDPDHRQDQERGAA
jgi:UDP-glucose 4-epimerase